MTTINKRWILNGVLLLLVAGLLGFIVQQSNVPRVSVETLYDDSMGDEIISIRIDRQVLKSKKLAQTLELEKVSGQWMMKNPIQAEVDGHKVKHLMTLLSDTIEAQYPIKGKDLSTFGLENNQVSIAFNDVKIQFGSLNPISHKRYLRKGDTLYIVAETVHGLLLNSADSFIQKNSN